MKKRRRCFDRWCPKKNSVEVKRLPIPIVFNHHFCESMCSFFFCGNGVRKMIEWLPTQTNSFHLHFDLFKSICFWNYILPKRLILQFIFSKNNLYASHISTKMANKNLEVTRFQFWFWLHIFIHGERSYFGLRGRVWLREGSAGAKIDLLQIGSTSSFPVPVEREQSIRVLHSNSGPFSSQFSFGCFFNLLSFPLWTLTISQQRSGKIKQELTNVLWSCLCLTPGTKRWQTSK